MVDLQQEHLLGLAGGFIILDTAHPEDGNGGFSPLPTWPPLGRIC